MGIKINDKEIYNKIVTLHESNTSEHNQMMALINDYKSVQSKIMYGMTGIATLLLFTLGWFINHIMKGGT